ncbi:MAG: type II secretion system protein [Bacteroides sp.]
MKRFKKDKKNNKGFSLVELIVVIAIMAVLVGVLAPTLIGNIEKSRESKDLQNLDSIRQAVVTAMSDEKVYSATVPTTGSVTVASGATGANLAFSSAFGSLSTEFGTIITSDTKMTSKSGTSGTLEIRVSSNGAVEVGVYQSGTVVSAAKNKVSMVSK